MSSFMLSVALAKNPERARVTVFLPVSANRAFLAGDVPHIEQCFGEWDGKELSGQYEWDDEDSRVRLHWSDNDVTTFKMKPGQVLKTGQKMTLYSASRSKPYEFEIVELVVLEVLMGPEAIPTK